MIYHPNPRNDRKIVKPVPRLEVTLDGQPMRYGIDYNVPYGDGSVVFLEVPREDGFVGFVTVWYKPDASSSVPLTAYKFD